MERRSVRIPELRQKNELSCMWGLFSVVESCQARTDRKQILNGRPVAVNNNIIDYPRKLDRLASFDEECRRIQLQNEADLASVDDMPFEKQKSKQNIVKRHQNGSELSDLLVKTRKRAKQNSQNPYQPSINELTLAAILRAVQDDNIPMSAKALVDQMFIHEKLISKNGKETVKSILDAEECAGLGPSSSFEKPKNAFATQKSRKTSFEARPADKIVILKPAAPRNAKHSENVTCHCSSLQSHKKPGRRAKSDEKPKSFSFREMKKKLKHTFGVARKEPSGFSMVGTSNLLSRNERELKSGRGYDTAGPRKLDSSNVGTFSNEKECDVILEAKKHLSARFKNLSVVERVTGEKYVKTLGRILASPEHDFWPVSPRRDGQHESSSKISNGREWTCLSPSRANTKVTSSKTSFLIPSTDEKVPDTYIPAADEMKSNGESKIVEIVHSDINSHDVSRKMQKPDKIELQKADENDSLSENEASTSTADDIIKYQDEHRSPVSVLDPFCIEYSNSPPSATLQTGELDGQQLKPRRLDFENCSFDSSPCTQEQNHISQYVHLVLEASCLNWDQLSEIISPHEELLDSFVFDEVEFISATECYFDPKLLFDRINEVLLEMYKYHFCPSPPWLGFLKPRIGSVPLSELVFDEIMKDAEFFLLPMTEKRTLEQLVSKDVANCGPWIDDRVDTEEIVIEVSEEMVEEFVLDVLVEFCT
ncbi:hypothetical protein PHJA_001033400 [Phtheirospermum japonicum]|uniref:DUF4378 domain-containing protein n=1 Tax=Phtheirospermum japonicum TaxID=374723 RepID=A0A830BMU6_9LAMI|nr:hypothetical protein PHJA_001033400 [Phtheirospermum japonicum]